MKTVFFLLLIMLGVASAAEPLIPDGAYSPPAGLYAGRFLEVSKGFFTCRYFSDVGSAPEGKAPFFAKIEKGRYQIDGKRLILLGDNPNFAEALFYREVDGVSVLLTQQGVFDDYQTGHPPTWEFFVLKPKGANEDPDWYDSLLKAHPAFAKWANP